MMECDTHKSLLARIKSGKNKDAEFADIIHHVFECDNETPKFLVLLLCVFIYRGRFIFWRFIAVISYYAALL